MKNTLFVALALVFAASCGSHIGEKCTSNTDCTDGYGCFTQVAGGFCSQPCETEGTTTICPTNTVCAIIAVNTLACSSYCTADSECPANLTCQDVPNATKKACRKP